MVRYRIFIGGLVNISLRILLFVFSIILLPALVSAQTDEPGDAPKIKGSWELSFESESDGLMPAGTFALVQKGNRLRGKYTSDDHEGVLMGSCSAEGEIFLKQIDPAGVAMKTKDDRKQQTVTIEFRGTLSGDGSMIEGTMITTDIESGKVVSERRFNAERK